MTRWKFDTSPRDPLVALRIPVTSKWPVFPYLVAFHRDSPHRPTAREALMLSSFAEAVKAHRFTEDEQRGMDDEPFDYTHRCATVVFNKYQRDDWSYRLSTWKTGSAFAPPPPRVATRVVGPLTLVELTDLIWSTFPWTEPSQWDAWKQEHPGVFA
jgi:hypothetical protein